MAIKKVQIIPPNYNDIIHPETDSSVVLMGSGKTLQTVSNRNQRFVIGISTAGWTLDDCDYLCNGTNDHLTIQQAIDDLPANGGEVVILDGIYNITASINILKDNVSIRGNGNATILKRMYNSTNSHSGITARGLITLNGRNGCRISDLQFDGNKGSYGNNNSDSVFLFSSSGNTIENNTFINSNLYAIRLSGSSNNMVKGNICSNGANYGMATLVTDNSSNNTIVDNFYYGNIGGTNIQITGSSSNNKVIGNSCHGNSNGIAVIADAEKNIISNNTVHNANNNAIRLQNSSNNTITGNVCHSSNRGVCLESSNNNYNCIVGNNLSGNTTGYLSGGGIGNLEESNVIDNEEGG